LLHPNISDHLVGTGVSQVEINSRLATQARPVRVLDAMRLLDIGRLLDDCAVFVILDRGNEAEVDLRLALKARPSLLRRTALKYVLTSVEAEQRQRPEAGKSSRAPHIAICDNRRNSDAADPFVPEAERGSVTLSDEGAPHHRAVP